MTRKQIENRIKKNEDRIKSINQQNRDLFLQSLLITDQEQQYSETYIEIGRGKSKESVLMGKITWKENCIDEDTGEVITIERSQFVKRNGDWIV
ncbi:hypothetical protein CEY12_06145 [Chryseobacterium sp. T16E-39]|uniref:hypothetical protein n=1 Tax=Chryseobacterium sp. T16E-39 TaxID=2015076 RepID=UPI000B5B486B|nr:hypothetical protein [Chryseobacterium sp. T16E-39]ASK29709.1 hypothetical protein CEY12_06145 [Chryseobacterium sp. T16E-39]